MWERQGLALLHFVWQGLLIAMVTAVVAACFPRGRRRYAAYLIGLAAMVACLPATFLSLQPRPTVPSPQPTRISAAPWVATAFEPVEGRAVQVTSPQPTVGTRWIDSQQLPVVAVWAWLIGASLLSARLPLVWLAIRRVRAGATPVADELRVRADALARTLRLRRAVAVMLSTRVVQPVVMGCLRPVILLPVSIATEMPLAMLEAVIAHELAHVRRLDLWVVYAQRLAETVLFYHPAVWWISSRISVEREICCDELAVSVTGRRVEYAAALEGAARHAMFANASMTALAFGAPRQPTLERVRHVLGISPARPAWGWTSGFGAIVVMATLFAVGCGLAHSRKAVNAAEADARTQRTVERVPRVLLVSDGDFFLERAMRPVNWVRLDVASPQRYDAKAAAGYDVVVFDGWAPAGDLPPVNSMFWGVIPADLVGGSVATGSRPVEAKLPDHPLLRDVDIDRVIVRNIAGLNPPDEAAVVAASERVPLLIAYQPDGRHTRVVVAFDHQESNWPMLPSFPVFLHNALVLLTGHQHVAAAPTAPIAPLSEFERMLIGRWEPASDIAIPGGWSFTEDRRFDLIVSGSVLEAGTWGMTDARQLLVAVDRTPDPKRARTYTLKDVEQLDGNTLVLRTGREGPDARRERYRRVATGDASRRKAALRAGASTEPTTQAATTRPVARLIFRPTTTNSGKTSWSGSIPDRPAGPGRAFMIVNAYRGDRWPIRVKQEGPPLCHAKIVSGDEREIELYVDGGAETRLLTIKLSQPAKVLIGGRELTISYGETTVNGDGPQYVDHATLIISFKDDDGDQVEYHKTIRLEEAGTEPTTQRTSGTSRRTSPMTTTTPTTSSRNP